ncbi:unnamed protein product [Parascedosporium putredinis]|uniref:Methyltransferase domain-containing protein n=1 Tax=Parascedosporium putredinis TaxID=1442378 RepID=A0A9P1GYV4_9PEZI|nr:unnamed protein product [Parascedosporium putredinis]CAI7992201.1 unnamed protein product [Parascedosporium putredinis]
MSGDAPPADLKARIKTSYDAIADVYNEWTKKHSDLRSRYLAQFIEHLPAAAAAATAETGTPAPTRILELGCGAGEPSTRTLAARPNTHVIGNDLSSAQIALARAHAATEWTLGAGSSVEFAEGDMADAAVLDFAPGSLDGVVALYSLFHLPREEQTAMMARTVEWLRPGGLLLATFSGAAAEAVVMEKWLREEDWMFWSGWGREGTLERLGAAGFEVVVEALEEENVDVDFCG